MDEAIEIGDDHRQRPERQQDEKQTPPEAPHPPDQIEPPHADSLKRASPPVRLGESREPFKSGARRFRAKKATAPDSARLPDRGARQAQLITRPHRAEKPFQMAGIGQDVEQRRIVMIAREF